MHVSELMQVSYAELLILEILGKVNFKRLACVMFDLPHNFA